MTAPRSASDTPTSWACVVRPDAFHSPLAEILGALRLETEVEVAEVDGAFWLRGDALAPGLEIEIRKIPGAHLYSRKSDGLLLEPGRRLPRARLPDGSWSTLDRFLRLRPQPAAFPGEIDRRVPLRLVRDRAEKTPTLIRARLPIFAEWVLAAPRIRLDRLTFTVSSEGAASERDVLVRGKPLPPIPGQRLVERDGVAVRAGYTWSPAVEPAALRKKLGLGAGDLAILESGSSVTRVPARAFAAVSAEAARLLMHQPC